MKTTTIRRLVILLIFVIAVAALALHTGTGNLSSLGWQNIAYICPLGSLEAMIASKTLIPLPLIVLVIVAILALVLGKVFCSWICPIPPIRRFFNKDAWKAFLDSQKKGAEDEESASNEDKAETVAAVAASEALSGDKDGFSEKLAEMTESSDEPASSEAIDCEALSAEGLKIESCDSTKCSQKAGSACSGCETQRKKLDSRHAVLGGALLSTVIFGFPVFCLVCPVGLVFATVVAWWRFVGFAELDITLILFPLIVVLEVVVLRKWCTKFCPLGATMSLLSLPNRFFRPKVDTALCLREQGIECDKCVEICPELLDPHCSKGMHECSKCALCKDNCPAQAITIPFKG